MIDTERLLYIYFAYDVPNTFQSNFLRKSHSKNKEKEENESVTANPQARGGSYQSSHQFGEHAKRGISPTWQSVSDFCFFIRTRHNSAQSIIYKLKKKI